jgi:hypothetical protein
MRGSAELTGSGGCCGSATSELTKEDDLRLVGLPAAGNSCNQALAVENSFTSKIRPAKLRQDVQMFLPFSDGFWGCEWERRRRHRKRDQNQYRYKAC